MPISNDAKRQTTNAKTTTPTTEKTKLEFNGELVVVVFAGTFLHISSDFRGDGMGPSTIL